MDINGFQKKKKSGNVLNVSLLGGIKKKMSEAKIGIILQNGKIAVKMNLKDVNQGEISLIITHLELLKSSLLSKFTQGLKKI